MNKNFDLVVGDYVIAPYVRSQGILDIKKGLGWRAWDVIVRINKVMDLTVCFEFNGDIHYELKDNVKKTKRCPNLFNEQDKIQYSKDSFEYRMIIEYGL